MKHKYFLLKKNVVGILNLFKNNLTGLNASNVSKALFYPMQITGRSVYPYLKAYFINPFLFFKNNLIYFGVANVAYSYPPGTMPTFFPCIIRLLRF